MSTGQLISKLVRDYKPEKVVLFGSRTRSDYDESSDYDLLIIKSGVNMSNRHQENIKIRRMFPANISVDTVVYSPNDFNARLKMGDPFLINVANTGEVLYG